MFGLGKDDSKKENKNIFEFDLEKLIKSDLGLKNKLTKDVEGKILEIKDIMRKGTSSDKEFEQYGILLRGYASLQKVMNRITK